MIFHKVKVLRTEIQKKNKEEEKGEKINIEAMNMRSAAIHAI